MKKVFLLLAVAMCSMLMMAQTNQITWMNGRAVLGQSISAIDSLKYGTMEDADTMFLLLPKTIVLTDTVSVPVIIHDTMIINECPDVMSKTKSGEFSVSETKKVHFAPANLQYQASTDTWRFAAHQYDYIGEPNINISETYSGWIDLFCWGTGNNPTDIYTSSTFIDWGINAIQNGLTTDPANTWRTLTKDEWMYIYIYRKNANMLWGHGTIDNIPGTILLPDNWSLPTGLTFVTGAAGMSNQNNHYYDYSGNNHYLDNEYTVSEWLQMESAGAVFLPAAGDRLDLYVTHVKTDGSYWSSTEFDFYDAYYLNFHEDDLGPYDNNVRYDGFSVRLVSEYQTFSVKDTIPSVIHDTIIIHDTIKDTIDIYIRDTITVIVHDTIIINKCDSSHAPAGVEMVDLGLPSGLKWANMNVGATKPEEYGDYFAWGETSPKSDYSWNTYFDTQDGGSSFTKYNNNGGKTTLEPEDDAATANWGGAWRMPNEGDIDELIDNCIWTWTNNYNDTGIAGYIVSSKAVENTNFIFLPAASECWSTNFYDTHSFGEYWASTLNLPTGYANRLNFSSGFYSWRDDGCQCYVGLPVRPVCQ